MKRTQETFKVVYSYTTGHDPIPNEAVVYVWALEGELEDAKRVFRKKHPLMNYYCKSVLPCEPPIGETILSL